MSSPSVTETSEGIAGRVAANSRALTAIPVLRSDGCRRQCSRCRADSTHTTDLRLGQDDIVAFGR